jgi:hypothetical protein
MTKPATKTSRRKAARDIKMWLGMYLYTLEPWYASSGPAAEECEKHKYGFLLMARDRLNELMEMEKTHVS